MITKNIIAAVSLFILVLISSCAQMPGPQTDKPAAALDRITGRGELIVGTAGNMPPLNMKTKQGAIIGYEADLAQYVADAMGVKLRFEVIPFADLLPALETKTVDVVLSGMTITPQRNLKAYFVGPYLTSGKCFLTKVQQIATAKDPSEVDSQDITLAALRGSTSQRFVENRAPNAKLIATKDYDEAVKLVIQDKVNALVADYPICVTSLLRYPQVELVSVFTLLTFEPLGIAIPRDDPLLVNWLENLLLGLEGSGKLKGLEDKWFKDASWLDKIPEVE